MKYVLRFSTFGVCMVAATVAYSAQDSSCINKKEVGHTSNGDYYVISKSASICIGQEAIHIVQLPDEEEISVNEGLVSSINDHSGNKLSIQLDKPFVKSTGFFGLGKKKIISTIDVDVVEMSHVFSEQGSFSGYSVDSKLLNFTFLRSKNDELEIDGALIVKGSNRKIIANFYGQEIALTLGRVFHSSNLVFQRHIDPEKEVLRDLTLDPTSTTLLYHFNYSTLAEVTSDTGKKFALVYKNEFLNDGVLDKSIHLVAWEQLSSIYYIYNHGLTNRFYSPVDSLMLE